VFSRRISSVVILFAGLAVCGTIALADSSGGIPQGSTSIFDGKDLNGWHVSQIMHHGTTPSVTVQDGMIVLAQKPYGQGGLLLSDKKYKNFELYVEAKPDYGCNGGIFFRSNEEGMAYQIELIGGAARGDLLGELVRLGTNVKASDIDKVWKNNDWNAFRLRVTGDAPHITLWVNGVQMWDVTEQKNDLLNGRTAGMIGFEVHWNSEYENTGDANFAITTGWKPGGLHRFRNIAIKELPDN